MEVTMNTHVRGPAAFETVAIKPALEIDRVSKTFQVAGKPLEVLRDVSLSVRPGEFVAIVGTSGCGKSTLLRLILGLDSDYEGDIRLEGERVRKPGLDRGVVFQEHRLLPWLTAAGNVAAAERPAGTGARAARHRASRAGRPFELCQRLAVAIVGRHVAAGRHRACAGEPSALPPARRAARRARCIDPAAVAG
jgi:ABC-type taurine transport system ATPase subunit